MGLGGGILGAVIGGLCGGPLGALIGGGVGLYLTRDKSTQQTGHPETEQQTGEATETQAFPYISFFICLGKMAKADGHVSQEEASFISSLLKQLNLAKEDRDILRGAFRMGRDSEKLFRVLASDFVSDLDRFSQSPEIRKSIMSTFCSLVAVDHVISPEEQSNLLLLERKLGTPGYVRTFFASSGSRSSYHDDDNANRSSSNSATPDDSLAASYAILGIPSTATDAEVKRAWHKKAQEFHPDRVQGAGLSQDFIDFAKKKMQTVNEAYETIRKHRGLS